MWKNVTDYFSEEQRHYKDTYLEIDEVYDEIIEVSLFSSEDDVYEIYISFDRLHGIVYVTPQEADKKREQIKKALVKEYKKNKKPTSDFINSFIEKFNLQLPLDIFFDDSKLFS